jgi:hypothetical protein
MGAFFFVQECVPLARCNDHCLTPAVHVLQCLSAVILLTRQEIHTLLPAMGFSRTQIYIAVGAGALLVLVFLGYLAWLNNQGPVLSKSPERDSLTGIPNSIELNPLRDRNSEKAAAVFIRGMKDGKCTEQLAQWEHDYRKKYAALICDSEAKHPLIGWQLVDWDDQPPLRILQYRGKRLNAPGDSTTYTGILSVTLEKKGGAWDVTKYDALY